MSEHKPFPFHACYQFVVDDRIISQAAIAAAHAEYQAGHDHMNPGVHVQDAIDEATKPLLEALRGLLNSSDCAWFHGNEGHDWRDAVLAAEKALRETTHRRTHGGG